MLTEAALAKKAESLLLDIPIDLPLALWNTSVPGPLAPAARECRTLADLINADEFAVLLLTPLAESRRLTPVFDSSAPNLSPLSRTLSSRLAEEIVRRLSVDPQPLWWRQGDEAGFLAPSARDWCVEVAAPGGEAPAIIFPVALERMRAGIVVFSGSDMMLDEHALCEVHARCHALFADVAREHSQYGERMPAMSKRELECLRLTANGLTSDAIAAALGLSVHTANQYLTNSTHKLNAVNRIHAVAKALRCGLID